MSAPDTTARPPMPRRDRLRRVAILCQNFARNLAYYRTSRKLEFVLLQEPGNSAASFWRVANGNFIDVCVLEWCKLFADEKGKHHWSKVISDPVAFEKELLTHLGIDVAQFQKEIEAMRWYRDKFLAHLDSDSVMNIPVLDTARKAVWFYHAFVVQHEAQSGDLLGLPIELDAGYCQCEEEARAVYEQHT